MSSKKRKVKQYFGLFSVYCDVKGLYAQWPLKTRTHPTNISRLFLLPRWNCQQFLWISLEKKVLETRARLMRTLEPITIWKWPEKSISNMKADIISDVILYKSPFIPSFIFFLLFFVAGSRGQWSKRLVSHCPSPICFCPQVVQQVKLQALSLGSVTGQVRLPSKGAFVWPFT